MSKAKDERYQWGKCHVENINQQRVVKLVDLERAQFWHLHTKDNVYGEEDKDGKLNCRVDKEVFVQSCWRRWHVVVVWLLFGELVLVQFDLDGDGDVEKRCDEVQTKKQVPGFEGSLAVDRWIRSRADVKI